MRRWVLMGAAALMVCVAGPSAAEDAKLPELGPLPAAKAPAAGKAELGKLLFFDKWLSGDRTMSCASCHDPKKGWGDGEPLSKAYPGSKYFRNAKSLLNMRYARYFHWDGRLTGSDRATMVRDQITETHFLNMDGRLMLERLKQIPKYDAMFKQHMGGEPSFGRTLKAVAAFMETLVSKNVPFDTGAMNDQAKAGLVLFKGKAGCATCHNGPMFSDYKPHALGVPDNPDILNDPMRHFTMRSVLKYLGMPNFENVKVDPGYFIISKENKDRGKFVTPTLREVSRTAPYMHNGMLATLEDVVEFYNKGGGTHPNKDAALKPLGLSADEKTALVEFLKALSGDEIVVEVPTLPEMKTIENWRTKEN